VSREQARLPAPRQDAVALTAATSAYAFRTSAVRYRSCAPDTREELRRQGAVLTVSQIDDDEAPDGTGHATHRKQASMIRRYIIWRNNHAYDERLRRIIDQANVA
jgi:hypothetical protein